jgi:thymidine phosphorylase
MLVGLQVQAGREVITMHMVECIIAKRDGSELSDDQIKFVIDAYTKGTIPDEQMSSLLMAIFWRGMTARELATWTQAMIDSGERIDLSSVSRPLVDKHSTGGVGDKISLPLCPLVAACGGAVPQLSGRGLGITGGTLDKMESIPGWNLLLSNEQMAQQLEDVGVVICAAGDGLAPADRKLYALRDVVGCIESIPLISSSIMSKKIAEGTKHLVLDVKVGSGAFMKDLDHARTLAETMVGIGERAGVKTVAMLTQMDTPLGRTAGNALEVAESVEVLKGGGPADVRELTIALATEMLTLAGLDVSKDEHNPAKALDDGRAYKVWCDMVRAQGGDPDAALPTAKFRQEVRADKAGFVTRLDAYAVGVAAWRLGAGRARKEDAVSAGAGVRWHKIEGDSVKSGDLLFELFADEESRFAGAHEALVTAVTIGANGSQNRALVIDRISAKN